MSSICELSDDVLIKILLLVEKTKEVVATSLVSKRWRSLWKLVPRLDSSRSDFINNFLLLSKAPVLETLHLRLNENNCEREKHERWVSIAAARHVRDLELLHYRSHYSILSCPRSLFTCKRLVVLHLQQVVIRDIPSTVFLQTLKTLSLVCVRFVSGDELVRRLLSACPILETLTVRRWAEDYIVKTFTIAIPSLQNLTIMERPDSGGLEYECEYVVNAPSLKTLKVLDKSGQFRSLVKMPKLVNAEIKIRQEDSEKLMGCLTSPRHLSLCLTSAASPPLLMTAKSCEFLRQLQYLELCTDCSSDWLCLVLRHSPKLRVLRLIQKNCGMFSKYNMPRWDYEAPRDFKVQWEEPCFVPKCLVSSLESVEWIGYRGTETEKEAAIYIIENSKHLKKMTLYRKITNLREKYRTLIDLASRMSCGCTCRLGFVPL